MAERNFAGARDRATADQTGVADGVVRRAEGARADETAAVLKNARDAMNASCFDGFVERHGREYRGNALSEHGLACAGRADE